MRDSCVQKNPFCTCCVISVHCIACTSYIITYTSMSKASKKDPECSNCGIAKSQHFFGRMDRRCPGPEEGDRPLQMPSVHPLVEDGDDEDPSKQIPEEEESDPPSPTPPGFEKVETHYWEATDIREDRLPVNKHTGIYAYHADDCLCNMAGWPCFRDGAIWSCCGETEKYSTCPGKKERN